MTKPLHHTRDGSNSFRFTLIELLACQGVARRAKRSMCFTLIELLVVVSIIGILASLLLPALARAKYQARLVICLNNQKQIATGAIMYTVDYDSRWPHRSGWKYEPDGASSRGTSNNAWPSALRGDADHDDRAMFNDEVFPVNELQCPFLDQMDMMNSTENLIVGGYGFYFGWKFNGSEDTPMLMDDNNLVCEDIEFDVIVSDFTQTLGGAGYSIARSTHPDYGTGTMKFKTISSGGIYWSLYEASTTHYRGPVELNFTRKDGSAFTVRRVKVEDTRLTKIPYNCAKRNYPTWFSLVPDVEFAE